MAVLLPFGSYHLGVHRRASDNDTLIVSPSYIDRDHDFFNMLGGVMAETKAVTELHPMPHAFVLVTKMRFHGMTVDLLCTTSASSWRPRALICMTVPSSVTCRY